MLHAPWSPCYSTAPLGLQLPPSSVYDSCTSTCNLPFLHMSHRPPSQDGASNHAAPPNSPPDPNHDAKPSSPPSPQENPSLVRPSSRHVKIKDHLLRPHLSGNQRTLSDALRAERSREEQETLLEDHDTETGDGHACAHDAQAQPRPLSPYEPHSDLNVYYNIHRIRRLILASIEDPYGMEQLKEPRMNVLIVKPLVDRLYDPDDISTGGLLMHSQSSSAMH